MEKSIKLNSSNIINIRKKLDADITKYWKIIRNENVMSKKAIKANIGSGLDLKSLYNQITQMQNKRVLIKGMLMYLNMGITTFDTKKFKKTNNYSIFMAGEAKEAIAQLKMIPTINPTLKAKKGLNALGKQETFTSAKIASLIKDLQLTANKYDTAMEDFNSKTEIDITDLGENFEKELTL